MSAAEYLKAMLDYEVVDMDDFLQMESITLRRKRVLAVDRAVAG